MGAHKENKSTVSQSTGILIIYIVVAYVVVRFIGRVIIPFVIKLLFSKVQKDFQNRQGGFNEPPREKGEVRVEGQRKKSDQKKDDDDSEYVDFEEVE